MRIPRAVPIRLLGLSCFLLSPALALAWDGAATTLDAARIARDIDPIFADAMATGEIPGAVFLLVQGHDVVLRKAYGYADPARKVPMDADRTAIHIGSVSKIFTATAVLQLVERGRLDLDTDVNRYLKAFQVRNPFATPLTLRHLLTHRGGLDDALLGKLAPTPAQLEPLGEHLARHMPPVIDPPGTVSRYSNYGVALAGYLVEVASGIPFGTYVERNIFARLGMGAATFVQPSPLAADLAIGHGSRSGKPNPQRPFLINDAPAGSVTTRIDDMARFMIAWLQEGRLGAAVVLEPGSVAAMMRPQHRADPRLPFSHGFGWQVDSKAGRTFVGHDGGGGGHVTRLVLVPELKAGFLVYFNRWPVQCIYPLTDKLFEHFARPGYSKEWAPQEPGPPDRRVDGLYRSSWYVHDTLFKFLVLLGAADEKRVSVQDDGTLRVADDVYYPVGPLLYRQKDSDRMVAFRAGPGGAFTLYEDATEELHKLRWWEASAFSFRLLAACVAVLASAVLLWGGAALWRAARRRPSQAPAAARRARLWTVLIGVCLAIPVAVAVVQGQPENPEDILIRIQPAWNAILLVLPQLVALLSILSAVAAVRSWRRRWWGLASRLHYSLVALASAALVWLLHFWNILGYRL
jgi:CubicO group peptidase (beta-lactamase class C family)